MKRKPGYYWVKDGRGWFIAQYSHQQWYIIGNYQETFEDIDFIEINETLLIAPDKQQG